MPGSPTIALFLLAGFVLLVMPGPAVLYIIARGMAQGRRAGLLSVVGIELGTVAHVTGVALGLSLVLMTSAVAFSVVKYLGAAYLVYLGIRTLLTGEDNPPLASVAARPLTRVCAQGFLVKLLNPKTALFFYAFLPQFVDPHKGNAIEQILALGGLYAMLAFCTDGAYALLAGSIGQWLHRHVRFRRARRYVTGGVYVGLGMTAALAEAERT